MLFIFLFNVCGSKHLGVGAVLDGASGLRTLTSKVATPKPSAAMSDLAQMSDETAVSHAIVSYPDRYV